MWMIKCWFTGQGEFDWMYQVTPIHYPSAVGFVAQQSKGLYKHLRTFKIIFGWGSMGSTFGSKPKSCSCQAMLGGRWQSFCRRSPSNSTDQCDAGGQRKALDQIFTANTLKWKESEADEANSEQVTMIYSPHPCSCPELEFRGIKVFSGVNDLFFHIFQRRQICK